MLAELNIIPRFAFLHPWPRPDPMGHSDWFLPGCVIQGTETPPQELSWNHYEKEAVFYWTLCKRMKYENHLRPSCRESLLENEAKTEGSRIRRWRQIPDKIHSAPGSSCAWSHTYPESFRYTIWISLLSISQFESEILSLAIEIVLLEYENPPISLASFTSFQKPRLSTYPALLTNMVANRAWDCPTREAPRSLRELLNNDFQKVKPWQGERRAVRSRYRAVLWLWLACYTFAGMGLSLG